MTSPYLEALKTLVELAKRMSAADDWSATEEYELLPEAVVRVLPALERLLAGQQEPVEVRAPFDPQAYWLPPGEGRKEMVVLASHYSKPSEYPDALGGWNKSGWVPLYSALAAPPVQEAGRDNRFALPPEILNAPIKWDPTNDSGPIPGEPASLGAPVKATAEGWRPIETAPKDGTHVLLSWCGKTYEGWWLDNSKTSVPWAGWSVHSMVLRPAFSTQPNAWQPIPEPAAPEQGETP